jgi:hypothetical protein
MTDRMKVPAEMLAQERPPSTLLYTAPLPSPGNNDTPAYTTPDAAGSVASAVATQNWGKAFRRSDQVTPPSEVPNRTFPSGLSNGWAGPVSAKAVDGSSASMAIERTFVALSPAACLFPVPKGAKGRMFR